MQDASAEFETAVEVHRTFTPPRLRTDWDGTGYAGDGTIDDLSGQMVSAWSVDHSLDDGYPDTVSFVAGTSVPELTTELVGRPGSSTPATLTSSWSTATANGVSTGTTATVTVPAGTVHAGEWLIIEVSVNSTSATVNSASEGLELIAGPTIDGTAVQTVVYARVVDDVLAEDGGSYIFTWTAAANYTVAAASVGARSASGRTLMMRLVAASQVNEVGTGVANHTTPSVAGTATWNGVVTFWSRGTTTAATWAAAAGDSVVVQAVGASGASDNLNVAIGLTTVPAAAGTFSRTWTTTSSSNATMGIAVFQIPVWDALSTVAYWSPQRTDSPVHGFDRDVAPVTLDVGLVTSAGREYARVFSGQMSNTLVKGGLTQLQTISAARVALMRYVQPPAFPAIFAGGLRATWPISFALWECGLNPGPDRRTSGCVWHVPMHGSLWRMRPAGNRVVGAQESWSIIEETPANAPGAFITDLNWITGPYVSAPDLQLTATLSRRAYLTEIQLDQSAGQPDAFSQAGNAARLEMWVKGVSTDVNNAPGGSGGVSQVCGFQLHADTGSLPTVLMGVDTTRHVSVVVFDGTNTRTLTSASTLPADDAWHFVGAAYDMTADRLWVNLDGTVGSSSAVMSTANLPTVDTYVQPYPVLMAYVPCAEITVTTGSQSNVDSFPLWRNDSSFAPTSRLTPSSIGLVALAEPDLREAWASIAQYAQAELAMMRPDEVDTFEYLTLGWWVKDDQQVVVDVIATDLNAAALGIDLDPVRIRNSVQVSYTDTMIPVYSATAGLFRPVLSLSSDVEIAFPGGVTVVTFKLDSLNVALSSPLVEVIPGQEAPLLIGDTIYDGVAFATLNDIRDGSGNYALPEQVQVQIIAWDAGAATLEFTNLTSVTWYLVNGEAGVTALRLTGMPLTTARLSVLDEDAGSIATRGARGIDVSATVLQTSEAARALARNLKMNLRRGVATIGDSTGGIKVTGNPLRQPGDLVEVRDAETGVADDLWRLQGVKHSGDGPEYTQEVIVRRVLPICIVGQGVVGESLVGPAE